MSKVFNARYDFEFKYLLVGDHGVGKTNLILRYTENEFCENFISTLGVDYKAKTENIDEKLVNIKIWDIAGEERRVDVPSSYYRKADAILLCYDITNNDSFESIKKFLFDDVNLLAKLNVTIILVGNKCDLESERVISRNDAQQYATEKKILFIETSSKCSINIGNLFTLLTTNAIKNANCSPVIILYPEGEKAPIGTCC
eukprot:TRINITY_DN693_c0_g1_i1.p1 TRINITY_DN693_c0_g1~~TRINITY_DN693_c0_g1_i1.p1  ORF type:complete len:200 (+),score=24.69 TRINITY_DN693_c0_g1_i1:58-657(+)